MDELMNEYSINISGLIRKTLRDTLDKLKRLDVKE